MLALALLALVILPLPVLASDGPPAKPPACHGAGCHAQPVSAQQWAVRLDGTWAAGTSAGGMGNGGTVPAVGQAYVAVGGGLAVLGTGLNLAGYRLTDGKTLWQVTLSAPAGTVIMSVRAWQGVITVGLLAPSGNSRTEVVISAKTGAELRSYPAALFGGTVSASAATTVVIGPAAVTSYANATGRVRWTHKIAGGQSWQADGQTLYLAQAPGDGLGSAPVTALKVIDLVSGAVRMLSSPVGSPFSGTLAIAAGGAVVFASPSGVTAYSVWTGGLLWTMRAAVPEGTDPAAGLVYLTSGSGALVGVDPVTGIVVTSVPGSVTTGPAAVYVVRDGVALGLDSGANGQAWGYDLAAGRVTWNSVALPWPHFFSDLSGLGGSAAVSGDGVVVTMCPQLTASSGICADPELVAFSLRPAPRGLGPAERVNVQHMSGIKQPLSAADRFQQRSPALAFPIAVWSKFKDDRAGNLAALISYYAFAALFPLLLVLVTVLNIVLKNNPSLRNNLINSALSQYPVIGPEIKRAWARFPAPGCRSSSASSCCCSAPGAWRARCRTRCTRSGALPRRAGPSSSCPSCWAWRWCSPSASG